MTLQALADKFLAIPDYLLGKKQSAYFDYSSQLSRMLKGTPDQRKEAKKIRASVDAIREEQTRRK